MNIDLIRLDFKPETLMLMNVILGLVMFGVSLELKVADFRKVLKSPLGPLIGWFAQFLFLPAATYLLTLWAKPHPSMALGMILVAACPGGNMSNFITHLARGNTALSVSMTAVSTASAVFLTPFNIAFWGSLNPETASLLKVIELDPFQMLLTVGMILGVPLACGMFISHNYPKLAEKLKRPFRYSSIAFFLVFVIFAFRANWSYFVEYVGIVFYLVAFHNAVALLLGYVSARLFGLTAYDSRAVAVEVGMQNAGLGLVLIFGFFKGLGGMAIVAAWWGIWHIVAGLLLAAVWGRIAPGPASA